LTTYPVARGLRANILRRVCHKSDERKQSKRNEPSVDSKST
jgi:hypothetical protein